MRSMAGILLTDQPTALLLVDPGMSDEVLFFPPDPVSAASTSQIAGQDQIRSRAGVHSLLLVSAKPAVRSDFLVFSGRSVGAGIHVRSPDGHLCVSGGSCMDATL